MIVHARPYARPVIRVVVTADSGFAEYLVAANNRSRHALTGAVQSAFRKFPNARTVEADFVPPAPRHD